MDEAIFKEPYLELSQAGAERKWGTQRGREPQPKNFPEVSRRGLEPQKERKKLMNNRKRLEKAPACLLQVLLFPFSLHACISFQEMRWFPFLKGVIRKRPPLRWERKERSALTWGWRRHPPSQVENECRSVPDLRRPGFERCAFWRRPWCLGKGACRGIVAFSARNWINRAGSLLVWVKFGGGAERYKGLSGFWNISICIYSHTPATKQSLCKVAKLYILALFQ